MRTWVGLGVGVWLVSSGCAEDAAGVPWLGTDPHFDVQGSFNGETLDFTLTDEVVAELSCEREYEAPPLSSDPTMPDLSAARLVEVKLNGLVTVGGEQRYVELELKRHDLSADPIGSVIDIVPRGDTDPPEGAMWLEWEWHSYPADVTTYEAAAISGSVELHEFSGTPDANGIIPSGEGKVGVTIDARWDATQRLRLSVTATCVDSDINLIGP